jgi:hypothetical protein
LFRYDAICKALSQQSLSEVDLPTHDKLHDLLRVTARLSDNIRYA